MAAILAVRVPASTGQERGTSTQWDVTSWKEQPMVTASCPECAGTITFQAGPPSDTVACPDCGAELDVAALNVSTADMSPGEVEDWGQ